MFEVDTLYGLEVMSKKKHENVDGRTDRQTDGRTDRQTR